MNSYEATGKTVKEAISKGLEVLGCDAGDVEVQILEMGTPGLFGLFGKPAKVKLTKKSKDIDVDVTSLFSQEAPAQKRKENNNNRKPEKQEEQPKAEQPKQPKPAKKPVQEAAVEEKAEETAEKTEEAAQKPKRQRRKEPKQPKQEAPVEINPVVVAPPIATEPFVATPEEELSETAKSAREFLKGLTAKMGVEAEIAVSEAPEQLRMVLSGENMSILIGRRGDTLDAIQYLTSLNVNRNHEDYIRVSLDTENYRAKREEALRKLAIRMASRCKKSGRRVALEPMNPYERRILHSALQADPDVTTHSEGEEPYRRVIITLK